MRTLGFRKVSESASMRERTRTRRGIAQPLTAWHPPLGDHTLCNCTILHRRGSAQRRIIPRRDRLQGMGSLPRRALVALPAASAAG